MKKIIQSVGAAAVAAAILCAAGCSGDTKWSFKTDKETLASGVWIYYTFDGVNAAFRKVQESNPTATIQTYNFNDEKIEGQSAVDWIRNYAEESCLEYLTLTSLADRYGIKAETEKYDSNKSTLAESYKTMNKNYSNLYEKLGVSEDSYVKAQIYGETYLNYKEALFQKIYGEGGEKEVKDEEIKTYFTENYISYYYATCELTETNSETGEKQDKEDKEKYIQHFNDYQKMLNAGKSYEDVTAQYKVDFETETPATGTATAPAKEFEEHEDESETSKEISKLIREAEVGKPVVKTIEDRLYLIYRLDVSKRVDDLVGEAKSVDFITRDDVVKEMKNDEYEQFLKDEQKNLSYEKNSACLDRYSVKRTIDILKDVFK